MLALLHELNIFLFVDVVHYHLLFILAESLCDFVKDRHGRWSIIDVLIYLYFCRMIGIKAIALKEKAVLSRKDVLPE